MLQRIKIYYCVGVAVADVVDWPHRCGFSSKL